ncbi:MAG: aminotransferase class III-fold pyridoxal phosphate-dependent enzyme [Vicinamibacterales bacterium]
MNRSVVPELVFTRAAGAYMWDAEGRRYVDYHAAFAPFFLGHNHPRVVAAIEKVLHDGSSLPGSGTTVLEGQVAETLCEHIAAVESLVFLNTGSEATAQALRLARAVTGRDHVIVTLGGYNGWFDDVARTVMPSLAETGPRRSPGEYPFIPMGAGIPAAHRDHTHVVNFNDLDSVRHVCERHPIAALMTEPILHNVGVVKPEAGYLEGLRQLADEYGFKLIFDEVKTGFRHAFGGYSALCGVTPDLVVYGKAVASGYPLAVLGGRRDLLSYFIHPDPMMRPLLAGTYNGHPVSLAAAGATLALLLEDDGAVYRYVETLGARLEAGARRLLLEFGITATISRQGSAFAIYFLDHVPRDWHDLAAHHPFEPDRQWRRALIARGVYFFPEATKQCSISAAHTMADIDFTLEQMRETLPLLAAALRGEVAEVLAVEGGEPRT